MTGSNVSIPTFTFFFLNVGVDLCIHPAPAPEINNWGGYSRARGSRRRASSAVGARIEAPKAPRSAPRGVGRGEGVKIFGFLVSKWWVVVHSGWYFLLFTCLFYTQK